MNPTKSSWMVSEIILIIQLFAGCVELFFLQECVEIGQKDSNGLANSEDPDQTARSSLIRVFTVCPRPMITYLYHYGSGGRYYLYTHYSETSLPAFRHKESKQLTINN